MKKFIFFSTDGDINELEYKSYNSIKDNYKFSEIIEYNKYNFKILFNKNNNEKKNLTVLPFYNKEIFGPFILLSLDENSNIKTFTEKKFLKLLSKNKIAPNNSIDEYSSDDFNLSDD